MAPPRLQHVGYTAHTKQSEVVKESCHTFKGHDEEKKNSTSRMFVSILLSSGYITMAS